MAKSEVGSPKYRSPARSRVPAGLGRSHSATGGTTFIIQHTQLQRYPKVPTSLQAQLGLVLSSVATGCSQPVVCSSINLPTESESPARARVLTGLGRNHSATGGISPLYTTAGNSCPRKPKAPSGLESRRGLTPATNCQGGFKSNCMRASINLSTESESPARARVLTGLGRNHSATGGTPSIIHHTDRHQKPKAPSDLEFRRGLTLATIAKGGSPTLIRHARHGDRERSPTFVGGG